MIKTSTTTDRELVTALNAFADSYSNQHSMEALFATALARILVNTSAPKKNLVGEQLVDR